MQTKPQTSKEYFTTLSIIHAALVAGQLLFIGVLLYINSSNGPDKVIEDNGELTLMLVATVALAGILGSVFISRFRLESVDKKSELKDKLADYRTTQIVKFALLEGPSLFALVCFLGSGNYIFLGISGLLIVILILNRPTKEKTMSDLQLSHNERVLIEDPKAIIGEV